MARKFEVLSREKHIESIKLADYATPYPETPEDEKREIAEEQCPSRNAFIRDRDRIVHSLSFRKLQNKTQVFISGLNPSIRNRLTHTMEVWQISVSLARMLRANIHLTEAIALGHDLGHTPFGHAGESELNRIMREKKLNGFSHNEQSVRVVSSLESPPNLIPLDPKQESFGLNLTYFTREGFFKHTDRFLKCKDKNLCDEFGKSYGTIEAQIVHVSDDIAQHTHDLHDIWKVKVIGDQELGPIRYDFEQFFGDKPFNGEERDISPIIGSLIQDVVTTSLDNLNDKYGSNPGDNKFIWYSDTGDAFSEDIKNLVEEYAIRGDKVNQMNSQGRHIIRSLYDNCISDPYCLPKDVKLKFPKIIRDKLNDTKEYKKIEITDGNDIRIICDYIASLTDQEAIDIFHSTLI